MYLIWLCLLSTCLVGAGVYTLKNQTIRLFTNAKLPDGEVRNRAIQRVGIFYIGSGVGLFLSTLLYFLTSMSSQPFILYFGIFGTLLILLRIDLNSY